MAFLSAEPTDPAPLLESVRRPSEGGLALFVGVVRDRNEGRTVTRLDYEAYGPIAEKEMEKIAEGLATELAKRKMVPEDLANLVRQLADSAVRVMQEIGLIYRLGDQIPKPDIERIATNMAEMLIEVMMGPARSPLARDLMMTGDLDFSTTHR